MAIMVLAGIALSASAITAAGTDLRGERATDFKGLIEARAKDVETQTQRVSDLKAEVDALIAEMWSPKLQKIKKTLNQNKPLAGFGNMQGDGLIIVLDDAPHSADEELDPFFDPNWLLIHQEDIQIIVNALWAADAKAVTIMDQRIIHTSDVKCVGSTLLVNGKVFSPPFVIKVIGPTDKMLKSLEKDEGVQMFKDLAITFDLTYDVKTVKNMYLAAFDGTASVQYAKPVK